MKLERVLWSTQPAALNLSIFTQLTVDRLDMLQAQCTSFQGPLSAAIHLALVQQATGSLTEGNVERVKNAAAVVEAFHAK